MLQKIPVKKIVPLFLISLGSFLTIFFFCKLKINSLLFGVILLGWLLSPYLACCVYWFYNKAHAIAICFIASFTTLVFFVDTYYIHPDPQGGIGILLIPFLQAGLITILFTIFSFYKSFLKA